ncbi:MAG: inorganic phosphate transporter, partial [Nanoarchaeota archaeon]
AIPTSSTFAIIGAIFGSGLVKGMYTIELKVMKEILVGWISSPLLGAIFAVVLFKILTFILT